MQTSPAPGRRRVSVGLKVLLVIVALHLSSARRSGAVNVTLDGSQTFQIIEGFGVNANQRGITNGLVVNFQGPGPPWLGGTNLINGYENEWAEMIASLVVYARNTRHLQFTLIAPNNEPDMNLGAYGSEGVGMSPSQYTTALRYLSRQFDSNGISNVRFVVPDAQSDTWYLWPILADPEVMTKVARVGLHSYLDNGVDSLGIDAILKASAYPDLTFWMTEFNVWCYSCEWQETNTFCWEDYRDLASHLLYHLANGATAGIVWEGYDSYYRILNNWSCWGLFAASDRLDVPRVYTPRKNFYTFAQVTRFVRPGARRIGLGGSTGSLQMLALYHPDTGQLTLTGVNPGSSPVSLSGILTSLPGVPVLDLYYTDSTHDLAWSSACPVSNATFSTSVPANCVFTFVGFDPSKVVPVLTVSNGISALTLSWPNPLADYILEAKTNLAAAVAWAPLTNAPQLIDGQRRVTVAPAADRQFFRLRCP